MANHFLMVAKNIIWCVHKITRNLFVVTQMLHKAWQQTNAEIGKNPISFQYFTGKENASYILLVSSFTAAIVGRHLTSVLFLAKK